MLQNLKMTLTFNGHVQGIFGRNHIALGLNFFRCDYSGTGTQHKPCGCDAVGAGLSTRLANVEVKQIFKHGTVALKTNCIDVRQIVRDHGHARLLRVEARFCYVK